MPNKIYNVKQAAKILGLSTNTTYKYLNQGRIKAARGHIRGTFIIPARSLEAFLGSKLPDVPISEIRNLESEISSTTATSPTFATKVTRLLITASLVIIIADIVLSKNFSPISQIARLTLIALLLLISYQFGGFIKK